MGERSIPKVKKFIHDMKPTLAKNAAKAHLQKLAIDNLLSSAYKDVKAEMGNKESSQGDEHYHHLLRSVTETVEKESNRNGVSDSLSNHDCKHLLDGAFLNAEMLQFGTLNWSNKKRCELVCGLMLRHPVFPKHYYVIAMNWLEAAMNVEKNCTLFCHNLDRQRM
jgi:hypothetical protein